MRILAVIPARSGSKRIPNKNMKRLGDKPLIAWTIEFAKNSSSIDNIIVSTDSAEVVKIAENFGLVVPWFRPEHLATDTASTADVIAHAIEMEERAGRFYEIIVLLQPTSPFRSELILNEVIDACIANEGAPVVTVAEAKTHPYWTFSRSIEGITTPFIEGGIGIRSQDLPMAYEITGSIYAIGIDRFKLLPTFFTMDTLSVISKGEMSRCDIDDKYDWLMAEALLSKIEEDKEYFN